MVLTKQSAVEYKGLIQGTKKHGNYKFCKVRSLNMAWKGGMQDCQKIVFH